MTKSITNTLTSLWAFRDSSLGAVRLVFNSYQTQLQLRLTGGCDDMLVWRFDKLVCNMAQYIWFEDFDRARYKFTDNVVIALKKCE